MPRTVITPSDVAKMQQDTVVDDTTLRLKADEIKELKTDIPKPDEYLSRLIKYIPTEIIALFVFIHPLLPTNDPDIQLYNWVLFFFCVIVTPFYLYRLQKVIKATQLTISTLACVIWVFAIGGPFAYWGWYKNHQFVAAVLPALYTFVIPIFQAEV